MRTSHVPVMHCEKMAVTDISFCQLAVTEFLVKEGNLAGVIYEPFLGVFEDVCMRASSIRRWVKHFKDGNTDIADQSRCGRPRTAATERNKRKVDKFLRQDRRITVRGIAAQLGVGHNAIQVEYRIVCSRRVPSLLTGTEKHKTAGNCSPFHPTVRIWPPQTTIFSVP
jgi:hypothetical protein